MMLSRSLNKLHLNFAFKWSFGGCWKVRQKPCLPTESVTTAVATDIIWDVDVMLFKRADYAFSDALLCHGGPLMEKGVIGRLLCCQLQLPKF